MTTHTELLEIINNGESSGIEFKRDVLQNGSSCGVGATGTAAHANATRNHWADVYSSIPSDTG